MVTVSFDTASAAAQIHQRVNAALPVVSAVILDDCNRYCKVQSGALRNSSYTSSVLADGLLIWDMPYAKYQYYFGEPSLESNPEAHILWADYAVSVHLSEWVELFRSAVLSN